MLRQIFKKLLKPKTNLRKVGVTTRPVRVVSDIVPPRARVVSAVVSERVLGLREYSNNWKKYWAYSWRAGFVSLFFVGMIFGVGPFGVLKSTIASLLGEEHKTAEFYAGNCDLGVEVPVPVGWQNPVAATGESSASSSVLSREDSAYFVGSTSAMVCGNFKYKVPATTTEIVSDQATSTEEFDPATSTEEVESATSTEDSGLDNATTTEITSDDTASSTVEATTTETASSTVETEPGQSDDAFDTAASTTEQVGTTSETAAETPINTPVPEDVDSNIISEAVDFVSDILASSQEIISDFVDSLLQTAEADDDVVNLKELGALSSATINLDVARELLIASSSPENASSTEAATTTESQTDSADAAVGATSTDAGIASTTPDQPAPISSQVVIWYSTNEFSTSSPDNKLWHELATVPLDSDLDCGQFASAKTCVLEALSAQAKGGKLSFAASEIKGWQAIDDLQVKLEADGVLDKQVFYVNSIGVTAEYVPGAQQEEDLDEGQAESDELVLDDKTIRFDYTDENSNENIIIKTDRKDYAGLAKSEIYFSVTNVSTELEHVNLQVHFPSDRGEVSRLTRYRQGHWLTEELNAEPLPEPNILEQALGDEPERKPVPAGMLAKNSTKASVKIGPGKTQYYYMEITYPPFTNGEFYIEAVGDSQGYGLLDPWWDGNWKYKTPINVNNSTNGSTLTDYQILVELTSTSTNFWTHVKNDASDLRFMNGTETAQLDFWIQYWDRAASSAQIWVKTDSLAAASTSQIYMYYGNASAATTSNMYNTFTYSTMQDLYYVVNSNLTNATITVSSLIDNNQVQLDSQTAVVLNKQQSTVFTSPAATSVLRAKGPVMARINGVANVDALVPISFAGTAFAVPSTLNTESWGRYAPFTGASVTIYNGNTLSNTTALATSTNNTRAQNITTAGRMLSTHPVLLSFWDSGPGDSIIPYPATTRDLYGIRSVNNYIGFTGNTTFTIYCSSRTSVTPAAQTTAARYTNGTCATGNEGAGNAVRLTAQTNPIGSIGLSDSDGTEAVTFLPDIEFSTEYIIPSRAQYVAIACAPKYGTTTLALYNASNVFVSSTTCATGGNYPGKAYFGSATDGFNIAKNSRIVSTDGKPFYAYYEDADAFGAATGGDEANLWGAVQNRKEAYPEPTYSFATEVNYTVTFSGKVYTNEGTAALTTRPVINYVVDGTFVASTTAAADGSYSFAGVLPPANGSTTVIFLASSTVSAATYSVYPGLNDVTNYDLYVNRVIVRHETAGPMTNALIDRYDSNQSAFIRATVASGNLTLPAGQALYIWPSDTFRPGGTITTSNASVAALDGGDIKIASGATLDMQANALSVGGDLYNLGTFSDSAGETVTFTATSTGFTIDNNGFNFDTVIFNGTNGGWSFATTTVLDGNLTMTAGTLSGTTSLAVNGGSVTGNGTINLTNGTFTLTGNGSLGGNTAWTFSSLTLGNGATVASTTKAGTGNITASGVVTVSLNHNLIAGGVTWSLTGGGTPLVLSGGIVPATSSFKYAGNSNTFVTPATYYRLELSPAAAGTPTYTLQSGNFVVRENMYVGDGINAVNATAATNNNSLDVAGDFTIRASGNYSAASSSLFAVGGSWSNSGVFAHSNGTLTLDSTSTGRTIAPGNSSFYNLTLNSTTGGWTISGNATTTGDFSLASASSFTLNSGVTLEARGLFTNSVGGASTTWTGSTLNINNGTSSMLNTKVAGADAYGTLRVSANADVKMWYSSATAYNVDSSGSLYSMDNGNIDGSLFIWGDYHISTGTTEYWNYQTDFDGVNLGASPRIAAVRLASSSVVTVDGGSLNIVGLSTATSTLANQGSGAYALRIYGGAFNGNYYQIKNTDANGLDLQGTPAITSLNNGDYELSVVGGSLIKLAASVINANPGKTVSGCRFATSSGVSSGYNVNLSGTPGQEWTFTGLLGSIAGEAYDFDPGDPRGYIVWDDSPIYLPVSKSWRFYHDENDETPTTPAAGERVSPSDIPAGNKIKLRLAVRESNGVSGMNVKMRLQYSTMPDFSSDVNYVGEIGSTSALWTFADGVDADNAAITALLLASTTVKATHNEIGSSTSTFLHPASTTAEWEFTIFNNAAAVGTTYYFRAYSVQYRDKAVLRDSGESYPSLVASGGSLGTALSGVTSGTSVDGVITNISTGPNTISFGTVPIGTSMAGAQRLQINTNAESGYQLFLYEDQDMINDRGDTITPVAATNDSPAAWPGLGFGYHTSDDTLSGLAPSRFAANDSYAKLENGMKEIGYNPLPTVSESIDLLYRLQISAQQQPGSYTAQVVYIVVPTY